MRAPHLFLLAALPAMLAAQPPRSLHVGALELQGGLSALYFRPEGQLSNLIGQAGGYGAHGAIHPARTPFSLRFDYRRVIYGAHTYKRTWYDRKARETVKVDSAVTNNLRSFLIGPQLGLPVGPIRPYIGIAIGGSVASTEWDVTEHRDSDEQANDCNNDAGGTSDSTTMCISSDMLPNIGQILGGHWTGSLTRTLGLVIPFNVGHSEMEIDLSLTEHRNGRTSLQREGESHRYQSDLSFRTIQVGVTLH
jgi:hypothetical protein